MATDLRKGFISNGRANNVTIFDLKTLMATGKVETGKNPDAILPDAILYESGTQRLFTFNGGSKDTTVIDAKTGMVISTLPVGGKPEFAQADGKGCNGPSGLAIDSQKRRLFAVCGNRLMAVVDPDAGKVLATLPIGAGADGAVFDNGYALRRGQPGPSARIQKPTNCICPRPKPRASTS